LTTRAVFILTPLMIRNLPFTFGPMVPLSTRGSLYLRSWLARTLDLQSIHNVMDHRFRFGTCVHPSFHLRWHRTIAYVLYCFASPVISNLPFSASGVLDEISF
jgi:hypothetical protein